MEDAHNQDAIPGPPIENRMACSFYLAIARPDMARVASKVGKFNQQLECFVQTQNVFFGAYEAPFSQRDLGDVLNVGVSFT